MEHLGSQNSDAKGIEMATDSGLHGEISWKKGTIVAHCETCPGIVKLPEGVEISKDQSSPTTLKAYVTEEDTPSGKVRVLNLQS